jgi:hydroxybutyrate-dimer hydrolase
VLSTAVAAHEGRAINGGADVPPPWLGPVTSTTYDGVTDDLLTAGLGKTGLGGLPPAVTDPTNPAQLRRLAIFNNYRAILDITAAGGYGTLYGPNVTADGTVTTSEGRIAGSEHLAYADDRSSGPRNRNVTLMVQVPATFDPKRPCIVTATSSGSRGIYGAIGSAGEWGLKRGCAVAYTDKGSGMGVHDLTNNTVNLIDGVRADAATAGDRANFIAPLSDLERQQFNAATPNRLAFKHAHSQQNPEASWGEDTLKAVEFAFFVLNEQFGKPLGQSGLKLRTITKRDTIVIASSVSNGAGAAIAAAEEDRWGLIDGVPSASRTCRPIRAASRSSSAARSRPTRPAASRWWTTSPSPTCTSRAPRCRPAPPTRCSRSRPRRCRSRRRAASRWPTRGCCRPPRWRRRPTRRSIACSPTAGSPTPSRCRSRTGAWRRRASR